MKVGERHRLTRIYTGLVQRRCLNRASSAISCHRPDVVQLALASLVPYDSSSTSASGHTAEESDEANGLAVDSPSHALHLRIADGSRAASGPAAQLTTSPGAAAPLQQRVRSFEHRAGDYAVVVYIAGECVWGAMRQPRMQATRGLPTWRGGSAVQVPPRCDAALASFFEQVKRALQFAPCASRGFVQWLGVDGSFLVRRSPATCQRLLECRVSASKQ